MENKKQVGTSSSSLDHLFGPKDSTSSSSSSSSGIFGSIFSTPSTGQGRDPGFHGYQAGNTGRHGNPDNISRGENSGISGIEKSSVYQNQTVEPCYFSSSIYYGGRENYSSRTMNSSESQHMFKKDGGDDDDAKGSNSNGASRGNWWQGSLYY